MAGDERHSPGVRTGGPERHVGAGAGTTVSVETQPQARRVRTGFIASAAVALAVVLLFVEGPSVRLRTPLWAVVVFFLWFGPAALYGLAARTLVGSVLVGLLVGLIAPALLWAVIETESSTAAIGIFTVAMALWAATAICLGFEALVRNFATRRRSGGASRSHDKFR